MNKQEKINKTLELYGTPKVNVGNKTIAFSRQSNEDAKELENRTEQDLMDEAVGINWINHCLGQVSLGELQRLDLIMIELDSRLPKEEFEKFCNRLHADIERGEEIQEEFYKTMKERND